MFFLFFVCFSVLCCMFVFRFFFLFFGLELCEKTPGKVTGAPSWEWKECVKRHLFPVNQSQDSRSLHSDFSLLPTDLLRVIFGHLILIQHRRKAILDLLSVGVVCNRWNFFSSNFHQSLSDYKTISDSVLMKFNHTLILSEWNEQVSPRLICNH